jgi:hypothetical protein
MDVEPYNSKSALGRKTNYIREVCVQSNQYAAILQCEAQNLFVCRSSEFNFYCGAGVAIATRWRCLPVPNILQRPLKADLTLRV